MNLWRKEFGCLAIKYPYRVGMLLFFSQTGAVLLTLFLVSLYMKHAIDSLVVGAMLLSQLLIAPLQVSSFRKFGRQEN